MYGTIPLGNRPYGESPPYKNYINAWLQASTQIEAIQSVWLGASNQVEATKNLYVKNPFNVQGFKNVYVASVTNTEATMAKWLLLSLTALNTKAVWCATSGTIEGFSTKYFHQIANIVDNTLSQWLLQQTQVEACLQQYAFNNTNVEAINSSYALLHYIPQAVEQVYGRTATTIEATENVFAVLSQVIESFKSAYTPINFTTQGFLSRYVKNTTQVESTSQQFCFQQTVVRPKVYFVPAPGEYVTPVTVTVIDELGNIPIYYSLDGSTPDVTAALYQGPLNIRRNKTLSIFMPYGMGNTLNLSGAYIVDQIDGKIIYKDNNFIATLQEDKLWTSL